MSEVTDKTKRLVLDQKFKAICSNVYYQPPASVKMKYPAIRYERNRIDTISADNGPYLRNTGYTATVISKDPDDPLVEAISKFPKTIFNRHYTVDNLNHDVFIIYE